jgi:hypothetical protein
VVEVLFPLSRGPQAHTSRAATVGPEAMSEAVVRVRGASDATGASSAIRAVPNPSRSPHPSLQGKIPDWVRRMWDVSSVGLYRAQRLGVQTFHWPHPELQPLISLAAAEGEASTRQGIFSRGPIGSPCACSVSFCDGGDQRQE